MDHQGVPEDLPPYDGGSYTLVRGRAGGGERGGGTREVG